MAVHVEETHLFAALIHPLLGQLIAESFGPMVGGQASELAPNGLDLGRAVQTDDASQCCRISLLKRLGTLDASSVWTARPDGERVRPGVLILKVLYLS